MGRLPFATKDEVFKVAKICVVGLCSRGEMVGDLGLDVSDNDDDDDLTFEILINFCLFRNAPRTAAPSRCCSFPRPMSPLLSVPASPNSNNKIPLTNIWGTLPPPV